MPFRPYIKGMIDEARQRYEMVSVRRAEPPPGVGGSAWYRYVITQGPNVIHGYRQGNLKTVTGAVKEIVTQLNERQSGKRSVTALKIRKKTHN